VNTQALALLFGAIVAELCATSSLKACAGFTRFWPSTVVIAGYGTAFYLLSLSLKTIPVGIAYAIWSGIGTAAMAVIGAAVYRERLSGPQVVGLMLIIAGVVIVNLSRPPAS
jgi:small multidrug resistance pump